MALRRDILNGKVQSEIINGHPVSYYQKTDRKLFSECEPFEQEYVRQWIGGLIKTKYAIYPYSSYQMKHWLCRCAEHDIGHYLYLTDNQFKDAMLEMGFLPVNTKKISWHYRVSQKSPSLCRKI